MKKTMVKQRNKKSKSTRERTVKELKREAKGITLIALVVTIIVLLILAGVAISLTIGQNGIFSRAQSAVNTWKNAEANEQLAMGELEDWIDKYENGDNGSGGDNEPEGDGDTTSVFAQVYKNETDGSEVLVFTNTDSYRESGLTYETSYDITNEHFSLGDGRDPETSYLPPWLQEELGLGVGYPADTKIKIVKIANEIKPKHTSCMFFGLTILENIEGIEKLNTKETIDMSGMFGFCTRLTSVNLSNIDTSKVTNMFAMFTGCTNLISLDLNKFDTRNVNNMTSMFAGCSSLTSLDLSKFDTRNVNNMTGMFAGCASLASLDVSYFNTSNVTNMSEMFALCTNLTTINVGPNWTIENADTTNMFWECRTDHVTQIG